MEAVKLKTKQLPIPSKKKAENETANAKVFKGKK